MPEMPDWQRFLSDDDRTTIERGGWAKRVGFGAHPAVILIDVQNYMVGEKGHHDLGAYPYSCASGWAAVEQTKRIVGAARAAQTPVIYTRFAIDRTVGDAGLFDAKIGAEAGENVYFEGTHETQAARSWTRWRPSPAIWSSPRRNPVRSTARLSCPI